MGARFAVLLAFLLTGKLDRFWPLIHQIYPNTMLVDKLQDRLKVLSQIQQSKIKGGADDVIIIEDLSV